MENNGESVFEIENLNKAITEKELKDFFQESKLKLMLREYRYYQA